MFVKIFLLLSGLSITFAQSFDPNEKDLMPFVLPGYEILDYKKGDLNKDKYEDVILILKRVDEDSIDQPLRPLLILLGNEDHLYRLAKRNDNVVICFYNAEAFEDPYSGITIKNGYFSIEFSTRSARAWNRIITFKYSLEDKDWYLHKDGGDSQNSYDPNDVETIVRTVKDFGVVPFEKFNYDEE